MVEAIQITLDIIGKSADSREEVNFYELFQGLTLDVIGQCGLAMKVNCQLDPLDKLLVMVKQTLKRQVLKFWSRISVANFCKKKSFELSTLCKRNSSIFFKSFFCKSWQH